MLTQELIDKYFGTGPHGNGLRWMSEYVQGRGINLTYEEKYLFLETVEKCFKEPGLLKRGPWEHSDQQAFDDYVAVLSACVSLGELRLPMMILGYGTAHDGWFDNSGEGLIHAWIWRMPQVKAHFEWAAGRTPSWMRRLFWCAVVATSGNPPSPKGTEFDTWAMAWHLVNVCPKRSWIEQLAASRFLRRFREQWPGMMADVSFAFQEGANNI